MLCQDCPKKDSCIQLCSKAERYVSQDYVSQRETTYPHVTDKANATKNLPLDNIDYHLNQKTHQETIEQVISYHLNERTLNFPFLSELQNKCLYLFYFEGLSYAEIARNLKQDKSKINYCIRIAKQRISQFSSKSEGENSKETT